jgi:hypothetical protein
LAFRWVLFAFFGLCLVPRLAPAAQPLAEVEAARRAGWDTVSILAQSMAAADARRFPGVHAWLKEFRAAGGSPGKRPASMPLPPLDASRGMLRSPAFWRAYFEIVPGEGAAMLLHAGLLMASGEISRAAYVLVAARQNSAIDRQMRVALESLLEFCQSALSKGARLAAEAAKLYDTVSPAAAAARLNEVLAQWQANGLAHYELGLATVAQQHVSAGLKPPPRARLSLRSEIPPSAAALGSYARARSHDPLLIRAYQGDEVQGGDVFLLLGKKVRPLWETFARTTEPKLTNDDLESLANALAESGIAETSLAVRQVLIGREGGYDDQDRKTVAAMLGAIAPAAADAVVKRLGSAKPEFIKIVLP